MRFRARREKVQLRDHELEAAIHTLAKLGPGVRHVYHQGLHAHGLWCRAAMCAYEMGLGVLTQRRVKPPNGPVYFEYIFIRSRGAK